MRCVCREFPNKLDHVIGDEADLVRPKVLHPAFYGCFDWHSSVHGHWMLVKLLKEFDLTDAEVIRNLLRQNLTESNLRSEAAYMANATQATFERPYGWAWLLKLALELKTWQNEDCEQWRRWLEPLVNQVVLRYLNWLPNQAFPVRAGTHGNTAFGLIFAWDFAVETNHEDLQLAISSGARNYFFRDVGYPFGFEPSGEDFLSPGLVEANLMGRILDPVDFEGWFDRFVGKQDILKSVLPITNIDRMDPRIGHLDGLNLSRAWCLFEIGHRLSQSHPHRSSILLSANDHASTGINHISTGNYMGEHWLASFAVLMLTSTSPVPCRVE